MTEPDEVSEEPQAPVYQTSDLVLCEVYTTDGELLGKVVDVLPAGGNDVFVVQKEKKEILLPARRAVIRKIDLENHRIEVQLPLGLRAIYEM